MTQQDGADPIRRAILAGGLASLVSPARADDPAGMVTDLRGDATAQLRAERRTLLVQAPVFVGDAVRTGETARASIALGRATVLRLGERARVTIDRFLAEAGGVLTFGSGALVFDRSEDAPPTNIQIRSTYGLIAVRGTRFFAGPSGPAAFAVFVERGLVTVGAAGRRVEVRAGQGVDIARPGAPPTRPRRWSPARIDAAFGLVA